MKKRVELPLRGSCTMGDQKAFVRNFQKLAGMGYRTVGYRIDGPDSDPILVAEMELPDPPAPRSLEFFDPGFSGQKTSESPEKEPPPPTDPSVVRVFTPDGCKLKPRQIQPSVEPTYDSEDDMGAFRP